MIFWRNEMNKEKKKPWKRPQLVVLGRGKPEERVLAVCKSESGGPGNPSFTHCNQDLGKCLLTGTS
jgi:hypothetical protein